MTYVDVTHIAVNVPELREAESYYQALFDLDVAWRDSDGKASLFASWEEIDAADAESVVVMLWNGAFRLALGRAEGEAAGGSGGLSHVGLQVSAFRLRAVRERVLAQKIQPLHSRDDELFVFRDRFGVEWELDTRSHRDPREIGRQVEARQRRERGK